MPTPPSNEWSIQQLNPDGSLSGAPRTLAALGIESATYDLNNMAADTLTFTVGGKALDAATLWPFGTLLVLLKPDGTRFFFGRVEPWTRDGRNESQNHLGRLVNPWWYLAQKVYEQRYNVTSFTSPPVVGQPLPPTTATLYTTPRVVLNILYNGALGGPGFYSATTGQQIADAVNWAIFQGAPIALGTVDPETLPFSDFQKGIFCSDVIKLMFRKEPDFVVDWDYTTTPFPTIHFRKKKSFTPLTIDLTSVAVRDLVSIKERPDWQRSYVKINYDQTNSTSAGQYLATYADWYSALGQGYAANGAVAGAALPADTESKFRGVDLFCDLTGFAATSTSQSASFASVPFDITSLATWLNWKPSLAAGTVAVDANNNPQVVILTASTVPAADANRPAPTIATVNELDAQGNPVAYNPACAFEVVDGQWAEWMPNIAGQRVRVTAWAKITTKNGAVKYEQLTKEMTVVSRNTNGISTPFTSGQTKITQYAEPIPNGLAKAMWTSWQNLAIEGAFNNVEAVIGTAQNITRSCSLNFLTATPGVNGAPDWRAVNALVQQISGDIAKGASRVSFGAPLKITGHDLIDAVRATRYRTTTIDLGYLFGGAIGGGNTNVQFGRKTHARHTQHGGTHKEVDVVSKAVSPVPGTDPIVKTDGATGIQTWQPPTNAAPTATVDPARCKGTDGNWHPVYLQEQKVCVKINGILKQRTLIAWTSDIYQAPDDPT
jgi:hypothetical protein